MNPSPFQQAIFDYIDNSSHSLIIEAVAGSGKTTTIVEAVSRLPSQDYIFLAFNKSIAEELKFRGVKASTFHALCFAELNSRLSKRPKVDSRKVPGIFQAIATETEQEEYWEIPKLVSLGKNSALTTDSSNEEWEDIIDSHELSFPSVSHAVSLAERVLRISNARLDVIDFDDMLYIPWLKNFRIKSYATVFVDEAQDTNALQLALLQSIVDPFGGRLIAVGDERQAIYGFRGAGTGSMAAIEQRFGCTRLPLSISYRCSKAVVAQAKVLVPQIEASETAPEGNAAEVTSWALRHLKPGTAVICRVNKPLIKLAWRLVQAGQPIRYLGRDLVKGMKKLIEKHGKHVNMETLVVRLEAERDKEILQAEKKGKTSLIPGIEDRYGSILALAAELPHHATPADLVTAISRIFTETDSGGVTLCTVHKSKGLEWGSVFILDRNHYMPHPRVREGWQLQQEINMLYVAITRAKQNLLFISSENFQVEDGK